MEKIFTGFIRLLVFFMVIGSIFTIFLLDACHSVSEKQSHRIEQAEKDKQIIKQKEEIKKLKTSLKSLEGVIEQVNLERQNDQRQLEEKTEQFNEEKEKRKQQGLMIKKLNEEKDQLTEKVLVYQTEADQRNQEIKVLKADNQVWMLENNDMVEREKVLLCKIDEQCHTENQLWVANDQLKSRENAHRQTVAYLQAGMSKRSQKNTFVNLCFLLLGGLFFLTLKEIIDYKRTQQAPENSAAAQKAPGIL